jgi:hypothetical protein
LCQVVERESEGCGRGARGRAGGAVVAHSGHSIQDSSTCEIIIDSLSARRKPR